MENEGIVLNTSTEDAKKQAQKERMAKARAARKKKPAVVVAPKTETKSIKLDSEITWFTEVDYNDKGRLSGDLPAYYFDVQIAELAEDIRVIEDNLDLGVYTGTRKRDAVKQLEEKKKRHAQIVDGKPKLKDVDRDRVSRSYRELGERIRESQYSESDMWTMKADPQKEADRMVNPCIKITDDIAGSIVKQHGGMRMVDGKVSRNHAITAWKVMGKVLGESTNAEDLRPAK